MRGKFRILNLEFILDLEIRTSNLWVYLLQLEQLLEEQLPQDELAVLLNFPPLEKANADIFRFTFLFWHLGQPIFSEELKTNFSNSWLQWSHTYS
ncbi:MAG: hypothetical protein A2156_08320 [Deltaproteobacteria bacterium RBG_16_48_10]|nr:MAG: hypothetical protein A2156_08320 [Deltaproteobacteria bacterium RBG_16_48_10]